jgi:carbamate kinase
MRPKIESALAFLERGGKDVLITSPEELGPALAGRSGTHVIPD